MYLFIRQVQAKPGKAAALGAALAGNVPSWAKVAGLPMSLVTSFGAGAVGTFAVISLAPDLSTLDSSATKLAQDPGFQKYVESNAENIAAAPQDSLYQVVGGAPSTSGPPAFASFAHGLARMGAIGDCVAACMDLAKLSMQHGASNSVVAVAVAGPYGDVAIITGATSLAQMEDSRGKLFSDPEFAKISVRLEEAGVPGTAEVILTRLLLHATP